MPEYQILKAVEYNKTSAAWRKTHAFEELKDLGWWLQPKYDGCFGMALMRPNHSESRMFSRTGEDYTVSCQHILDEIAECAENTGTVAMDEGYVVLGEVWHPEWAFPKISGSMRRRAPCPELCFVTNDLLPADLTTALVYRNRFEDLKALIGEMLCLDECTRVTVTDNLNAGQWTDAAGYAVILKNDGGFDGAILRDPNASYTIGEAKHGQIIKVKPVLSLDLECCRVITVKGDKTGRDVFKLEVVYRGVKTLVGSGVPHTDNISEWLAYPVEIECMGVTEDGALREPRFKGVRYDKLKVD